MARPKATGETKSHQQHVLMTPSEVEAIDEWRFRNHIGSRGEAIRRLCQNGLTIYEDVDLVLEEAQNAYEQVVRQHQNLWTIMMQIRGRHEHASPPLPARNWTAEEVVERSLDWSSDMYDLCRVLYLDLLKLNNAVIALSETKPFSKAQKEALAEVERIEAERAEVIAKKEEARQNRLLGIYIHWAASHPSEREKYEALSDDQQDQYLNRVCSHIGEVGDAALSFTEDEEARVTRRNDEPFDFSGVADLVAGQVLLSPNNSPDAHVTYILTNMPTADRTMVEIMVEKATQAAVGRDVSMPTPHEL